jgi:catechol 2,3-dioxygenase-like lactoylglutathione lyase family enzyme
MIGYCMVGTNDLEKARSFYDSVLKSLGAGRVMEFPRSTAYGNSPTGAAFAITQPYDGQPATAGNGTMVSLAAKDTAQVDATHAAALAHGGTDEGAPGYRGGNFYGAYFRDLDGNKLCVFCIAPQG